MVSLILIGLIGGVLTSLSPCIIPVLPLVLAVSAGDKRRPYYVVAGMVVSFAAITLSGSIVLNLLGLPQDTVRWVGIGLLVLVGLGMLIPVLGEWVQAPFDRLPRLHALLTKAQGRGGFMGWPWARCTFRAPGRSWPPLPLPRPPVRLTPRSSL